MATKKISYEITSAAIKDDYCHYSFDITEGTGEGDTHAVKGKGIIDDDMREVFTRLNVHLACIDDIFKHSKTEVKSINKMHNNELTGLYRVEGFKIKGSEDNMSVILIGTKYLSTSGHMALDTPKIALDKHSAYKWWSELKDVITDACEEVKLYKEGKYTEPEEPEIVNPKQMKLTDVVEDLKGAGVTSISVGGKAIDFDKAKK